MSVDRYQFFLLLTQYSLEVRHTLEDNTLELRLELLLEVELGNSVE